MGLARTLLALAALQLALTSCGGLQTVGGGGGGGYSFENSRAYGVARDSRGRIKRSSGARSAFKRSNPCPSTGKRSGSCPGYVIDHVTPLKRGGADSPSNMQWQTEGAARAKDRWE